MSDDDDFTVKTVIRVIARGGFGRVEEVDLGDDFRLARKVFDPSPELGTLDREALAKLRRRFEKEVRTQTVLAEYGAVPVLASHLTEDPPSFLMPLADMTYEKKIEIDRAAGVTDIEPLIDILNGLSEIHRLGYVHRDLKPQNVLLLHGVWRLSDFGLTLNSNSKTTTRLTGDKSHWGTQAYMAPEQSKKFSKATAAADIYAFGCILHDLIDGRDRIPFATATTKGRWDRLIRACTASDPAKRPQSIEALREALVAVAGAMTPATENEGGAVDVATDPSVIAKWDAEQLQDFLAHAEKNMEPWGGPLIQLEAAHLEQLAQKCDEEDWARFIELYCTFIELTHSFAFCDVLCSRIESLMTYPVSGIDASARLLISMAIMAEKHNRWHAMTRLMEHCSPQMHQTLAERVALEIRIGQHHGTFRTCAKRITRAVSGYHPRIADLLSVN